MAEESKNLSKADKPVIDIKGLWSEEETASKTNNMSKVQKLTVLHTRDPCALLKPL